MKRNQKQHVKIGDKIQIISGNEKDKIGTISSINKKKNIVTVDTVLPRIKSLVSKNKSKSKKIELQIPIHISNIMLWDIEANNASRIGYKIIENKKVRYFKKSGNNV